jgi:hypothetical protein
MTHIAERPDSQARDRVVLAMILIAVGVGALVLQFTEPQPNLGGWVVVIIGIALLGAYTYTRQFGYVIPGGIMTGLGAGIVASEALTLTDEATGGVVVLGLGLGFLSVWVIGAIAKVAERHWWPLIPGGILSAVGGALVIGGQAVTLLDYWGVAVIALGLLVLVRTWSQLPHRA